MDLSKKIIALLLIVFLILVLITLSLSSILKHKKKPGPERKTNVLTTPTPVLLNITINKKQAENILKKTKILNKEQLNSFKEVPVASDSPFLVMKFSKKVGKLLIQLKEDATEKDLLNYLKETNPKLYNFIKNNPNSFILTTDNPDKIEDATNIIYLNAENNRRETIIKLNPTPTLIPYEEEQFNNALKAVELLLNFSTDLQNELENTGSASPKTRVKKTYPSSLSLTQLFEEVGKNVGVPPKILAAVMHIESPQMFYLTEEQIAEYSKPGNTIPSCYPNECSATGPMQMTVGLDAYNSPSCSHCCWKGNCLDTHGGCPDQWNVYGNTVNNYNSDHYPSNPCNLRDNLYAAAAKLKNDSHSTTQDNWTKEEVYRAAKSYYGNCTRKYSRLGNRTYCEYVWWYYTNR